MKYGITGDIFAFALNNFKIRSLGEFGINN